MGKIAKYNTFKAISTLCTIGAPVITLASCSELFVHNAGTSLSAAGVFALLISLLFAKDKILENFKAPSALVLSVAAFVFIVMVENILLPMKTVCIVTMITAGIDEVTFKNFYKRIKYSLPNEVDSYQHFGFLFTTSSKFGGA
jgi:hypothetical protein